MNRPHWQERAKEAAGKAAVALVKEGMHLGLGTGSTVYHFIRHLIPRVKEGLRVRAIATSERSATQAREGGIEILSPREIPSIDLTVDGADAIDPEMGMIKGGGGALLREKIIATQSKEVAIIVDATKCVPQLGGVPLPIEVVPFGWEWVVKRLENRGHIAKRREKSDLEPYITDNGNYILDIALSTPIADPEALHNELIGLVGVIETGLFCGIATHVIVGQEDGSVKM